MDYIGRIAIPTPEASGELFQLESDYGYESSRDYSIVEHRFGAIATLGTQRFYTGYGPRRFQFKKSVISRASRAYLFSFFEQMQGAFKTFYYAVPKSDKSVEAVEVIFDQQPLTVEELVTHCRAGITFVECPTTEPEYPVNSTSLRFPNSTLQTALLGQEQTIIPLVHIRPRECDKPGSTLADNIYLSDRRCRVGGQLYIPRVLGIGEPGSGVIMSQSIDGAADNVQFTFGSADGVFTRLANDTDLKWATVELCLYHVQTGSLLQLWKGYVTGWESDGSPQFSLSASDGLYQINQQYPILTASRTCKNTFDDGNLCPYSAHGSGGNPTRCSYYHSTPYDPGDPIAKPGGCVEHHMSPASNGLAYFGGHPAIVEGVNIKDNSTGVWGMGRNQVTATSIVSDTVFGKALPEIWCNDHGNPARAFHANCLVTSYRDEGDFSEALAIVGAGPIGSFTGVQTVQNADGYRYIVGPQLDGFFPHGFKVDAQANITGYRPDMGLREVYGNDPASQIYDSFSLGHGTPQVWNTTTFAAGTAFVEIRVSKDKGIQPSTPDQHQVTVPISQGLHGYTWNSSGASTWAPGVTNPFWVAVNCYLRALGLQRVDNSVQLDKFVLSSLTNGWSGSADIADTVVNKLFGSGTEPQFEFQGTLSQQKPFRDWLTEILATCLGYFTFEYGKLKLGCRYNASAVSAFTLGNILYQSLTLTPIDASFDGMRLDFADPDYQMQANIGDYIDKDHAAYYGRQGAPHVVQQHILGAGSLSQVSRLAAIRTREEIGGVNEQEWRNARRASWKTTILALDTEVGQVVSMTHPDMPGGAGNMRIERWTLHSDWSVSIEGRTVTPSMYDLTVGPRPQDVTPNPLPILSYPLPVGEAWAPCQVQAAANDALYPGEWSFGLEQSYATRADSSVLARAILPARLPVTQYRDGTGPPTVTEGSITQSSVGGSIPGGKTYRVSVIASDGTRVSPPSQILLVKVPSGTNTNSLTVRGITWPAVTGLTQGIVFVSDQDELICAQQVESLIPGLHGYSPVNITVNGPFQRSTWGLPNSSLKLVRAKGKRLIHGGTLGAAVTSISGNSIFSSACIDPVPIDNWTGRILTIIGRRADATPFESYNVVSFNAPVGEFVLDRAPTAVREGDAFVVLMKGEDNSSDRTRVHDSGLINRLNSAKDGTPTPYSGLTPHDPDERGLIRVLKGLSRGEVRKVVDNGQDYYTVDADLPLDSTSVWILEGPSWEYQSDVVLDGVSDPYASVNIAIPTDNFLGQSMLFTGVTIDINSNESPESVSPFRMMYVFGEGGTTTGLPNVPLVTDVVADAPFPYLDQATLKVAVPLTFNAPADLGEGANRFTGYEVFCETPDGVVSCGKFSFSSTAGSQVNLSAVVPYPSAPVAYWLYVASLSDEWQNPLVSHTRPGPTPNVMVEVAPFTGAPFVRKADAGRLLADATFEPEMYWDDRRLRMLIDTGCIAPANTANFTGVQFWVQTPLTYVQVSDTIPLNSFTDDEGSIAFKYLYFNMAFDMASVPVTPETWDIIFVSLDRDGNINRDVDGNPTGPRITLDTLSKVDYVEDFAVEIVHGRTDGGDQNFQLRGSWTNPVAHRYKGQRFVMRGWGDDQPLYDATEGESRFVTDARPKPDEPKSVTIYAVPIFGDGTVGNIVPGETPSVDLTIARLDGSAGVEVAPLVTSFSVTLPNPAHAINGDGQRVLIVDLAWTNPTTIEYGGATIFVAWHDGRVYQLTNLEHGASYHWETTNFLPVAFDATFYILSNDTNNHRNTYVNGVTPEVLIHVPAIQTGPLGSEYAPLVTSFSGTASNPATADGTSPSVITFTFTAPTTSSWGDIELMEFDGTATRSRGHHKTSPIRLTVPSPTSVSSYTYYAVSRDVNQRRNTLVSGITPETTVSVGSAAGTFDATKFKTSSFDTNVFINTGGPFRIWAFDGSIIVNGSVSTAKLNTTGIDVGGGGNKPGKIQVFNSSSSLIAAIGVFTGGEGIWAKTGGFGDSGTGPTNPPFKADASGNVSMTGATISLSGSSGTDNSVLLMDPSASYAIFRMYNSTGNEVFARPGMIGVAAKDTYADPWISISRSSSSATLSLYAGSGVGAQGEFTAGVDKTGESVDFIAGHLSSHYMRLQASGSTGYVNFKGLEVQVDGVAGYNGSHNGATYSQGILVSVP